MASRLYSPGDFARITDVQKTGAPEPYRSEFRRDQARLLHSACFRRLQGKTQVFPGHEGDFFRNRLTHSLEVAQIAKSIAIRLNSTEPLFSDNSQKIDPDLVEFAGMAHDLGHPPFGHNGEAALDECMRDFGGFEGNAQTLRILTRLEKKATFANGEKFMPTGQGGSDDRCGLNLTYRALASILKYDFAIPERARDRTGGAHELVKGFYNSDAPLVAKIKNAVIGEGYTGNFKTVECTIMDIADDIAYSTYDLEDVFKSGFLKPLDLFSLGSNIYQSVLKTINSRLSKQYPEISYRLTVQDMQEILYVLFRQIFDISEDESSLVTREDGDVSAAKMYLSVTAQERSNLLAENGYYRTEFTSDLVGRFIDGVEVIEDPLYPQLHKVRLEWSTFAIVEVLKNITYEAVIRNPTLQVVEYRGKDMIKKIFEAIEKDDGNRLLPMDFNSIYINSDELNRKRTICDFIAGMTDRYAVEYYSRLFGANGTTMHKKF